MTNFPGSMDHNPPQHLLTSEEAERRLKTHYRRFDKCIRGAWTAFLRDYGHKRHILCSRSIATILFDEITHRAQSEFAGIGGIVPKTQNNSFLLYFGKDIAVRFKKFGKDGRCRNIPTRQQNLFAQQRDLPGMEKGTMLQAGYVLDDLRQNLLRTMIVCQYAKRVVWTINLSEPAANQAVAIAPPTAPQPPQQPRFESKIEKKDRPKNNRKE